MQLDHLLDQFFGRRMCPSRQPVVAVGLASLAPAAPSVLRAGKRARTRAI